MHDGVDEQGFVKMRTERDGLTSDVEVLRDEARAAIVQDPANPDRIFVAISAAGAFRTEDGGRTWKPINAGLKSQYELPDPQADVGHLELVDRIEAALPPTIALAGNSSLN